MNMFTSITKTRVNNEALLRQLAASAWPCHAPFHRLLLHRATAADDEHVKMSLLCGLIAAIAAIDLLLLLLLQRHARY